MKKLPKKFKSYDIRYDRTYKTQNTPGAWVAERYGFEIIKVVVLGTKEQAAFCIEFALKNPTSEYNVFN